MRSAIETLQLDWLDVVHAGGNTFALGGRVRALAASSLQRELKPIR